MKLRKMFLFCLSLIYLATVEGFGIFTNQGNLEKMFLMEEEIMSLTEAFLRREFFDHDGADPHNLTHIVKFSEKCKNIHKKGKDIFVYLKHPINIFHLVRRLHEDWPTAINSILSSEPCKTWNIYALNQRIHNIRSNIPSKEDMLTTASSLVVIMETTRAPIQQFAKGIINGSASIEALSLSDLVLMGKGAYDEGNFKPARTVLAYVHRTCLKNKSSAVDPACNSMKNLALIAQSYGKMRQYKEAVKALDEVLKIDPNYKLAKLNRKYFLSEINKTSTAWKGSNNWRVKYTAMCTGTRKKTPRQLSRLKCEYYPTVFKFVFVKAEWLHNKPPIMVFHDFLPEQNIENIKTSGWAKIQYIAHDDLYATPNFAVTIRGTASVKLLKAYISNLQGPQRPPVTSGTVEVRNYGMQGLFFYINRKDMLLKNTGVGSFFLELPATFEGGEYVFPKQRVKTQLQPGSVLFFFASKSIVNICPVTYGTKWAALMSVEEEYSDFCRLHDNW